MSIPEDLDLVIRQAAEACGVEVADLALEKNRFVRVVIDSESRAVNIGLCQDVNRAVRDAITEAGQDVDTFHVEVMSPGVNRRLTRPKDYERFRGERVRVTLREPADGQRNHTGTLQGYEDGIVTIRPLDQADDRTFERKNIREVRLAPDPKELLKKGKR